MKDDYMIIVFGRDVFVIVSCCVGFNNTSEENYNKLAILTITLFFAHKLGWMEIQLTALLSSQMSYPTRQRHIHYRCLKTNRYWSKMTVARCMSENVCTSSDFSTRS